MLSANSKVTSVRLFAIEVGQLSLHLNYALLVVFCADSDVAAAESGRDELVALEGRKVERRNSGTDLRSKY